MTTNWVPGLITLGVGLAGGAVALVLAKRRAPAVTEDADVLQARADKAIEALRELTADRHQYDEAGFAVEKTRLEREAAEALRERARLKKAPNKAAPVVTAPRGGRPKLVGALYGGGFVGLLWLLTALISAESTVKPVADERTEALLVLGAISISVGDHEKILQFWESYMNQPPPRRRPPMLQKAYDWLEKAMTNDPG